MIVDHTAVPTLDLILVIAFLGDCNHVQRKTITKYRTRHMAIAANSAWSRNAPDF